MGLPSGTLWAKCDIDITKPNGLCDTPFTYEKSFFSWGNTDGHNPTSASSFTPYSWGGVNAQEPWYDGQVYGNTKGNTLQASIPVSKEYDAAMANLGQLFKMPSSSQFKELIDNCIFIDANGDEIPSTTTDKRVTVNGIGGLYLQSTINGNRLFFACSGYGNDTSWNGRGGSGDYWSASFYSVRSARYLYFYGGGVYPQINGDRYYGFAIRPIKNQ